MKRLLTFLIAALLLPAGEALAAPANDAFSAATAITQGSIAGSTVGATSEPGEPDHYGKGRSVWYRWTAPGTGGAKVSVCGSGNVVAVYTEGLALVTNGGCERTWPAKAGTSYRIAVDTNTVADGVPFILTLKQVTTLPNLVLAGPLSLSAGTGEAGLKEITGAEGLYVVACTLDGSSAKASCLDPAGNFRFRWLGAGTGQHTLSVQVRDGYGNLDPTPLTHTWTVDATPPDTTITGTSVSPTTDVATASLESTEPGGTFECSVEGGAYKPCASPFTFAFVGPGLGLQVRAFDAVGNGDASPALWTWLRTPAPITPKPVPVVTPAPTPVAAATPAPPVIVPVVPRAACQLTFSAPKTITRRALAVRVSCRATVTVRLRGRAPGLLDRNRRAQAHPPRSHRGGVSPGARGPNARPDHPPSHRPRLARVLGQSVGQALPLDVEVGHQARHPLGHPPGAPAEQGHHGRDEREPDEEGVGEHAEGQ